MYDIKAIIEDTVNTTVLKLKMAGLFRDSRKTAYQKTEEILRNYPAFKDCDKEYTARLTKQIENALESISDDIYYDIIPMSYFENNTREYIAEKFGTTVTTISRNKARLINKLKVRLFSDDVIFEIFM